MREGKTVASSSLPSPPLPMQRVLDRGPPPSVTLTTPEAVPASVPSEFQDAAAADDDSQWRFSGSTIPDDPQASDR